MKRHRPRQSGPGGVRAVVVPGAAAVVVAGAAAACVPLFGTAALAAAATSPRPTPSPSATIVASVSAAPLPAPTPSPSKVPVGSSFSGTPAVGALFVDNSGTLRHFCSGAVVHSPQEDLVITAAHCLENRDVGLSGNVTFAPGYNDGKFPYGRWVVRTVFVDSNWQKNQDPNDDVAFLVVGTAGQEIEKETGAETLKTNFKLPQTPTVIGYPDSANDPIECTNSVSALHKTGYQDLVFDCDDYTVGTSGGPFLTDVNSKTGLGDVIGVIGGYERGGDSPNVSYSSRFLSNVANLYNQAISASSS